MLRVSWFVDVRSVDTQVWELHLVDGDGLMLGVSR